MKENKFWAFNCFYEKLFSCSAKYTSDLIVKKKVKPTDLLILEISINDWS